MRYRSLVSLVAIVFYVAATTYTLTSIAQERQPHPNIVLLLADDLGYGDVQCNNPDRGKIKTLHIDRLAAGGMRFTDAHSSSGVCSPSRYALLTGRYHWRTRLQNGIVGVWGPPLIAENRMTIASLAKQHGYATACIGKWHLGWDWPIEGDQKKDLTGFGGQAGGGGSNLRTEAKEEERATWREVFSKTIQGGPTTRGFDRYFGTDVPNWPPYCFIENNRTLGIPSTLLPAKRLVKNQGSLQGPALPDWSFEPILSRLGDEAEAFIEKASQDQKPFLLYMPLTTPHTPLAVNKPWKGKSGLDNDAADLIMETDALVGRIMTKLETAGLTSNTLVVFTSDNGFAPYAGAKELEARGHYPSGPLRDYKSSVYEGGHRIPFIVQWPGEIAPRSVCEQLVHHADLLATLADILGTRLPENAGEDSFSLVPLFTKNSEPTRVHAVSCGANGVPSFRDGFWKLILAPDTKSPEPKPGSKMQLYHLGEDLSETKNLAAIETQRVESMRAAFERMIENGRSTPGPNQKNDVEVKRFPNTSPASR